MRADDSRVTPALSLSYNRDLKLDEGYRASSEALPFGRDRGAAPVFYRSLLANSERSAQPARAGRFDLVGPGPARRTQSVVFSEKLVGAANRP